MSTSSQVKADGCEAGSDVLGANGPCERIAVAADGWTYRASANRSIRSRPQGATVTISAARHSDHLAAVYALLSMLEVDGSVAEVALSKRVKESVECYRHGRAGFGLRSPHFRRQIEAYGQRYVRACEEYTGAWMETCRYLEGLGAPRPATCLPVWLAVGVANIAGGRVGAGFRWRDVVPD